MHFTTFIIICCNNLILLLAVDINLPLCIIYRLDFIWIQVYRKNIVNIGSITTPWLSSKGLEMYFPHKGRLSHNGPH